MLTEMLVKSALEVVVGQGFKAIVERVFRQEQGKSDRQILEAVLLEVHRHGGAIGNMEMRLVQLEHEVSRMRNEPPLVTGYQVEASPSLIAPVDGYQNGAHFKQTSGGYMNFYNRSRKQT